MTPPTAFLPRGTPTSTVELSLRQMKSLKPSSPQSLRLWTNGGTEKLMKTNPFIFSELPKTS